MSAYRLKKNLAAMTGLLDWKWNRLSPGLYVFNYHRIGDAAQTQFDPNIFSANEAQFEFQIGVIKSRFKVIGGLGLLELLGAEGLPDEPLAMITFDDGYLDNYTKSLPILKSMGVSAIYFLPTDYIGNSRLPWWEKVAWMLRQTNEESISLPGLPQSIAIDRDDISNSIRQVLRYFKDYSAISMEEKLSEFERQCQFDSVLHPDAELFMNWEHVRRLNDEGMSIGSHTCSHRILSQLPQKEQRSELLESKRLIESEIGAPVDLLAYPVGGIECFTNETQRLAEECGYKAAFSFPRGGCVTSNPCSLKFSIPRLSLQAEFNLRDIQFTTLSANRL